eukprot:GHVL01032002.1.p1 GENE.GHVL01032002.1~~GHVL01032002.1.p1  ORF type:complete len:216 (-),score=54.63 GHVL01032002.1:265-912(-)
MIDGASVMYFQSYTRGCTFFIGGALAIACIQAWRTSKKISKKKIFILYIILFIVFSPMILFPYIKIRQLGQSIPIKLSILLNAGIFYFFTICWSYIIYILCGKRSKSKICIYIKYIFNNIILIKIGSLSSTIFLVHFRIIVTVAMFILKWNLLENQKLLDNNNILDNSKLITVNMISIQTLIIFLIGSLLFMPFAYFVNKYVEKPICRTILSAIS